MTRKLPVLLVCALVVGACSGEKPTATPSALPSEIESISPSPKQALNKKEFIPAPDQPLPRRPSRLAAHLAHVRSALRRSVDRWLKGGIELRTPREVLLQTIYQQRIYRRLARDERKSRVVLRRLPRRLRPSARRNLSAGRQLVSLVTPVKPNALFDTQRPQPAVRLLRHYRAAQRRFAVDWEVLAAINFVETRFGRIRSNSIAGAQGPMQFIASTWEAYGLGGDIQDPRDAIMAAANYLSASGAPQDYRSALYAYNHAIEYVNAIWIYAREMMRDPHNYLIYYNYQVYMITTRGDVRLTGPGADV
jgi:membrane-bound lytic murein transglycosylase B